MAFGLQVARSLRTPKWKAFVGKRIIDMRAFLRDIQSGLYFGGRGKWTPNLDRALNAPWREFSAAYGGTLLAHRSAIGTPAYYGPQGRSRCQPVPPSILRGGVNGDPVQAGSPS